MHFCLEIMPQQMLINRWHLRTNETCRMKVGVKSRARRSERFVIDRTTIC